MKTIVVGNWKLNPQSQKEAQNLFEAVKKDFTNIKNIEMIICPPFLYLENFRNMGVKLGAQNCFWENPLIGEGVFTGEVSAQQLKDVGCEYVIVGHSERRHYFGETDEMINKKINAVLSASLKPILCVGEKKEDRDNGKVQEVVEQQIILGLKDISENEVKNIIVAYEPVWAIGTGNACSPIDAQAMGQFIKETIQKKYSQEIAVLYGGSVTSDNSREYIAESKIDGLLVGGSSLIANEFLSIIKSLER